MKNVKINLVITLIFSLSSTVATSQNLLIYSGVEKTVSGNQAGGAMLIETKRQWALGAFYQGSLSRVNSESLVYTNPFYGVILQAPLVRSERLFFFANLRTGLVNKNFIVVVPSLETRVHFSQRTGLCFGTGFRHGYPSISAKVFLKIF